MANYDWSSRDVNLDELKGSIISGVDGLKEDSDVVFFTLSDGREFKMHHEQDCCESVYICDVCGDVDDIIGSEIIHFEERTEEGESNYGTWTATFYDIQTAKGSVNIRWNGESNGYYSESVSIVWSADE